MVAGIGALLLAVSACADPASSGEEDVGHTARPKSSKSVPGETGEPSRPSGYTVAPAIEPDTAPGADRLQEGDELPDERIDESALPEKFPRKVSVAESGHVLNVVARERGCGQASAELVEQAAKRVTVLVVETKPADSAQRECRSGLRYPTVSVSLDEPLGDRAVELRSEIRHE